MKRLVIASCLLGCVIVNPLSASILSEIRKENPSINCNEDVVIFSDQSQVCGKVEKLPSIKYTFGSVTLNPEDIAAVSINREGERFRIQCITLNGETFEGTVGDDDLEIMDASSSPKEINPNTISFIILGNKKSEHSKAAPYGKLHIIKFKNGDRLPVLFNSDSVAISNGYTNSSFKPQNILEITNNGGLNGELKNGDKTDNLEYSFLKDRFIEVHVPYANLSLKLPWDSIDCVKCSQLQTSQETKIIPSNLGADKKSTQKQTPQVPVAQNTNSENQQTFYDFLIALAQKPNAETPKKEVTDESVQTTTKPEATVSPTEVNVPLSEEKQKIYTQGFVLEEPKDMVLIPGGRYMVSKSDAQTNLAPTNKSPMTVFEVPSFYIDSHPVTNEEYQAFVQATHHRAPYHWTNGVIPKGTENQPVINVSYHDAVEYANWTGKRLPTESEWEVAAKHVATGKVFLNSMKNGLAEWTSTPAAIQKSTLAKQPAPINIDKYGSAKMIRERLVFDEGRGTAKLQRVPLQQDERDSETSFRLVIDQVFE